ncbi:unnamed protein product [Dibothriocephalus latus]|uniref:MYND-type domain-containing protein n=1 Tax=Dibothriocephalus latus TaxID=60516 RepID=A0A3P6SZ94_DIBLA|nr:unnamed protein product [Dibothriocephalus latus]
MAVQAGDISLTHLLLQHGANANVKLPQVAPEKMGMALISEDRRRFYPSLGGLAALHFAVLLPGRAGVQITEMLLDALADPNTRAEPDLSFLTESQCKIRRQLEKGVIELDNAMVKEEYAVDGGRIPLHLVCSRDYDTVNAVKIVNLLLQRGADPNILCNGYSPLSLAIANGSEQIVDRLLADPRTRVSLPLTHGLGNALCVAAGTQYEFRWPLESRLRLIRKLIDPSPLDLILVPVRCPPDCSEGNVVDHVYYQFAQDKSTFGKAFYSLTPEERAVSVGRAAVLELLAEAMREASCQLGGLIEATDFVGSPERMLYRYCYECGRSVDVKLVPCTRCKKVFYCSSACKFKSWSTRHKKECQLVKSKSLTKKEKPPRKGKNEAKAPGEPRRQDWIPGLQIWHVQDPDFSEEAASNHPATDYGFRFGFYMRMDRQERVQLHSYPRNGNYSLL